MSGMNAEDAKRYELWNYLRENELDQKKVNDIILTNKGLRPNPETYLNSMYIKNHRIKDIFENVLMDMLEGNGFDIYVVVLYIMNQLFKEKNNLSPFKCDFNKLLLRLQHSICNIEDDLKHGISNGAYYSNLNAWDDNNVLI